MNFKKIIKALLKNTRVTIYWEGLHSNGGTLTKVLFEDIVCNMPEDLKNANWTVVKITRLKKWQGQDYSDFPEYNRPIAIQVI